MKSIENQGFLTTPDAMGRSVAVKAPPVFKTPIKSMVLCIFPMGWHC